MSRVGQNHTYTVYSLFGREITKYTVYIRYFWQGTYQSYGHIRCKHTVLANPIYEQSYALEI